MLYDVVDIHRGHSSVASQQYATTNDVQECCLSIRYLMRRKKDGALIDKRERSVDLVLASEEEREEVYLTLANITKVVKGHLPTMENIKALLNAEDYDDLRVSVVCLLNWYSLGKFMNEFCEGIYMTTFQSPYGIIPSNFHAGHRPIRY